MLTAAQREAQRALNNVGASNPKPERCGWCREFRGLHFCPSCKRWFCWRHIDHHACPDHE